MNILILTPIHPMQIVEMNDLVNNYNQYNNIFSIQQLALLAEETLGKNYIITNEIFTREIKNNPKLITNKKENTIIFGNLDKNTDIQFDYIISYISDYLNYDNEDIYLKEAITKMKQANIENSNYFDLADAEYCFPTMHHLFTFLKTCGIKENDKNGI